LSAQPWPDTTHLPLHAFQLPPGEPSSSVLQVLRVPPDVINMTARILERAGFSVPRHPRDSYARALWFLLPYALAYADDWWERALEQLKTLEDAKETP